MIHNKDANKVDHDVFINMFANYMIYIHRVVDFGVCNTYCHDC